MHNQKLMKETHAEVQRLLQLSFTPLVLVGIPRARSGKCMETWKGLAITYAMGLMCCFFITPFLMLHFQHGVQGVYWAGVTMLVLAVFLHVDLVRSDIRMFASIKNRLEGLIEN